MRNPQGYAVLTDPGAARLNEERDTFTCAHCRRVVHVRPMCNPEDMGGRCLQCEDGHGRGLICKGCVGKPCTPFMRALEKQEARERLWSAACA